MNLADYIDSTYLKTSEEAQLLQEETQEINTHLVEEAIQLKLKCVMLRPTYVSLSRNLIDAAESSVLVGTVIDFPNGTQPLDKKLKEAQQVIEEGADELDFVCNYPAFISGNVSLVLSDFLHATEFCLHQNKTIKWIIETAALSEDSIKHICELLAFHSEKEFKGLESRIFLKSSTGFLQTPAGTPNGATPESIALMLEYGAPLPIKASGGIKTYSQAMDFIHMGVQRIGTSSAQNLIKF